jgi:ABC-type transport system involved in multi-copper enzyme maturation permease subunit
VTLSERLRILFWLVRDTFAQSLASGIGWLLFGLSTVCIIVCLSASVSAPTRLGPPGQNPDYLPRFDREAHDSHKLKQSGVAVAGGSLRLAFGAIRVPVARDGPGAVHFLQLVLAAGVADTLGLLLTLVWTAGFLPGFLDPRAVAVLLAKPISRSTLLLGKYVGVLAFVAAQAVYFVAGTWLALAIRTGVWDAVYLRAIPLLLLHFAIFFSFSLLLAVCTRSTVVCVFGSIAFWGICWAINFGRHAVAAVSDLTTQGSFSAPVVWLADICYWLFPKPVDLGRLVFDALGAGSSFRFPLGVGAGVSLWLSVLTSLLFTGYVLFAAARQFARADY